MQRRPSLDTKLVLYSLAIFLVLMAVFVPSFVLRQKEERQLREMRERFTSAQVAERFSQLVSMRLRTLELLEYTRSTMENSERFAVWSARIEQKVQGFYAINWVDPRGVITMVAPEPRNVLALGKNLLERDDIRPYLVMARDEKRAVMSHVVELYQGPLGFAVYLPIYDESGFKGWINGVFTTDELLGNLLVKGEFDSSFFSLKFVGHDERVITSGTLKDGADLPTAFVFPILNQQIEIHVAPNVAPHVAMASDVTAGGLTWLIFALVTLCSVTLSVFAYLLMLSRQRLEQRLQKERIHGVLLNLLVHDIINPLMIVRFGGESAQKLAPPELKAPIEKVLYGVAQISDVIGRVKDMRAVEAGRFVPKTTAVAVNDLIEESSRLFDQRMKAKELDAVFEPSPGNPRVLVDRVIFQNNVLNNLLSNAVKFSEKGGQVRLSCLGVEGRFVVLEVKDQGVGMSEGIRANLFLEGVDTSRPGTLGEKGTGIGMMQVQTYVRLFGGHVSVDSRTKQAGGSAHGTTFKLFLPLAP